MGVGAGLSMYVVVVQKFTFAISSPDEFLFTYGNSEVTVVTLRTCKLYVVGRHGVVCEL